MAYSKTESITFELAEPIVKECGCYIYDVEFVREGGLYFLRVYADKDGGISIDECEEISRALSKKLDEADPIKQNYYLEVSSPGIERKLKTKEHFERYMGETVDIGLYKAVNGSKQITAKLTGFKDGIVKTEEMEIPLKETTFVKLHFEF
ncbi:MAG: ribosome maturation factor RimP [Clostridia bacterium]|nr:ribosome maturation factor RimP [Clostridia bacterium]